MKFVNKYKPLLIALSVLVFVTIIFLALSLKLNQGHLVYTHDDAFIHMALAKHFSQDGIWGVTKYNFSSSSSSLLWTLVLSIVYYFFGVNTVTPFFLNFIVAVAITITAHILFKKFDLTSFWNSIALLLLLFLIPIIPMIFSGMEHLLHLLISIIVVYLSAKILSTDRMLLSDGILLSAMAPLLVMARYEGLFLIFAISCLFFIRKRILFAILLGTITIIPLIVYGLISINHGWYFLPNSVLLKGTTIQFDNFKNIVYALGYCAYKRFFINPPILFLYLMVFAAFIFQCYKEPKIWIQTNILALIFLITIPLQMQFAGRDIHGYTYNCRYDACTIGLGIIICFAIFGKYLRSFSIGKFKTSANIALAVLTLFMFSPLICRSFYTSMITPGATNNIYQQQCQMGLFLHKFYDGNAVALNDIGAVNYFADIKLFDLIGLASIDSAEAFRKKTFDSQWMQQAALKRNIDIAVLYEEWFDQYGRLPDQWKKVGSWTIPNNVICGGPTVTFYAVNAAKQQDLTANLKAFSSSLPKNVIVQLDVQ